MTLPTIYGGGENVRAKGSLDITEGPGPGEIKQGHMTSQESLHD